MISFLTMMAGDPSIDPALKKVFSAALTPARQAAIAARNRYIDGCKAEGKDHDPILADIEYQRALAQAEGRVYYAGD